MKFDTKSQRVHLLRKIDHKDFIAKVLLSTGLIFLVASGLLGITADLMTPDLDWNPIVNSIQIAFLSFALFLDSIGLLLYINILFLRKKVKKWDFEEMEQQFINSMKSIDSEKKEIWTIEENKNTNKKINQKNISKYKKK